MTSNLMKLVASSVAIANHAGHIIRSVLNSGQLGVIDKAIDGEEFDPQTEADRSAQCVIIGSLKSQFPGINVIGEEDDCESAKEEFLQKEFDEDVLKHSCPSEYEKLNVDDMIVWVDPLDGTAEFTKGHVEHVTILIGISSAGKAIAGVIHQPFYSSEKVKFCGRTIWGVKGIGSFGVHRHPPPSGRRFVVTTLSHDNASVVQAINSMNADKVIRVGGCGFKVLQVIEGSADAYVFATPGTKKWDTCAPEAIISAMGGCVTDMLSRDINYGSTEKKSYMNWCGVLVTFNDHESYASKVPEALKKELNDIYESKMA
ncbi:3'(2'),5'-bisphosphate nucleotidase 1 [Hydra vulgaris]|uniref:3'(2'),5'-bisphosphate nucleotidase 1 n=1 Tax=Hydra vulgaris TaxID=6087 RepID=A0ABM4CIF0_HYDVU